MADGGVSIAVRSVYPGKQACTLLSNVLQKVENTGGKVVRRALSSIGHERQYHHRYERKDVNPSALRGRRVCHQRHLWEARESPRRQKPRRVTESWFLGKESRQM